MTRDLVAAFATERALQDALQRLRAERLDGVRTYTPKALDGAPEYSPLPLIIFIAGLVGASAGFAMEVYANAVSYPIDIGGRPEFSWPSFVPIAFEIGVLFAILAGVLGYFIVNRMPALYEPIDESNSMRRATSDRWVLAIRLSDEDEIGRARAALARLHPAAIEELPA
jgi:hypothetical protein